MLDNLLVLTPITMIVIALLLACALWVARRRRTGASLSGSSQIGISVAGASRAASDPYFFPFGEMPIVRREDVLR